MLCASDLANGSAVRSAAIFSPEEVRNQYITVMTVSCVYMMLQVLRESSVRGAHEVVEAGDV